MSLDTTIVRAAIHPGIGIARVGNSRDGYYIGPEVTNIPTQQSGFYKDGAGAIKREAARFRIYGFNASGEVVKELTADEAEIEWTVHVANKKAAWYNFELAMDIPEAVDAPRRNIDTRERSNLVIDPGSRSVSGILNNGETAKFDSGTFFDKEVYLGELRTDEKGRLLFLGGRGDTASYYANNSVHTFGNNDGWHDDTSDGPVSASVTLKDGGATLAADPAWVVVAPPNYGPEIISIRTIYDVLTDIYKGQWDGVWSDTDKEVSFTHDVLPILARFNNLQWVNYGFFVQFGWKAPYDFSQTDFLQKLSKTGKEFQELRRQIYHNFRSPSPTNKDGKPLEVVNDTHAGRQSWPWIYGDAAMKSGSPRQWLALTKTQYAVLEKWVLGDFVDDFETATPSPQSLCGLSVEEQPAMLDKAALHFCLGDAFHPGCEMTWPVRHTSMYRAPFRFRMANPLSPALDYGDLLKPSDVIDPVSGQPATGGPLFNQAPGDITRWMAIPWQTDTASCRAGYKTAFDPYVPTFWPARVPNHVLTQKNYDLVMDESQPLDSRIKAFNERAVWYRELKGEYINQINQMIDDFGKLGIVEKRPGPTDTDHFPAEIFVETGVGFDGEAAIDQNLCFSDLVEKEQHYLC